MPLGKNHMWLPASLLRTSRSYATLWHITTLTPPKPWLPGNIRMRALWSPP